MSQQVSNSSIVNIFKKVYGDISNLVPEGFKGQEKVTFEAKAKVGESYNEAVILTNETGWTLGGSSGDIYDINPAVAGAVQQAIIPAYSAVLNSVMPFATLSRSASGGEKAFIDGTKFIVKNNITSHMGLKECIFWYGQATYGLGTVSYATATYRGVSLTTGTGTVGGIAFTNGVNTTTKSIMFQPGQFASGHWVGREGCGVKQILISSGAVVASGSLVSVDSENGIINVDFVPAVATAEYSHKLVFEGMDASLDAPGVNKILTNTGTLFNISAATYSLWKGTQYALPTPALLTFARMQFAASNAMNRGGTNEDLLVYCNPRSFGTLVNAEAARRMYDQSYGKAEFDNGAEAIKFYYAGGSMTLIPHRYIKEGEAYGMVLPDWLRSGSTQISLTIPGIGKEVIFPLENSTAYCFRSFSDEYLFCRAPARSFFISNINDESAS